MTINDLEKALPTITDVALKADIEYILEHALEICLMVEVYEQLNKQEELHLKPYTPLKD